MTSEAAPRPLAPSDIDAEKEEQMPLFAAAVVAARRGRRPQTIVIPVSTPPLWRMLVDELALATRRALAHVRAHGPPKPEERP